MFYYGKNFNKNYNKETKKTFLKIITKKLKTCTFFKMMRFYDIKTLNLKFLLTWDFFFLAEYHRRTHDTPISKVQRTRLNKRKRLQLLNTRFLGFLWEEPDSYRFIWRIPAPAPWSWQRKSMTDSRTYAS